MNNVFLLHSYHRIPYNGVLVIYLMTVMILLTFNCRIPYKNYVGGVLAMTKAHFIAVNGYSNLYFGWGGEDDDMSRR